MLGRGIGLVFSGGGARGVAGLGVLRALRELDIPYDAVGGASIGALVGGVQAKKNNQDFLTGALLGAAPPLILYAFLMDYYIAGLTAGATKG